MYSKTILAGNLGADPKIYENESGLFVTMTVATKARVKKGGEYVDETTWHNVTATGHNAEFAKNYFKKGTFVIIEGHIQNQTKVLESGKSQNYSSIRAHMVHFVGAGKIDSSDKKNKNSEAESQKFADDDAIPF